MISLICSTPVDCILDTACNTSSPLGFLHLVVTLAPDLLRLTSWLGPAPPVFTSPEMMADRHVAFRILRPRRKPYRLFSTDIFGAAPKGEMTKAENGVWEITDRAGRSWAYRYNFNVDGVPVMDPRNPSVSESNGNAWSVVYLSRGRFHGNQGRAARRRGQRHVFFEKPEKVPANARVYAARI